LAVRDETRDDRVGESPTLIRVARVRKLLRRRGSNRKETVEAEEDRRRVKDSPAKCAGPTKSDVSLTG
jgi:hypothetical protein